MNRHHDSRSRGDRERIDSSQIAHAHSGAAQPVPLEMRSRLEPLFQHNFGDVRIYSDAAAAATADALHAKAFTVGQDIAFAAGRYDPHSSQGQRLMMHELAHTVQQRHATPNSRRALEVSQRSDSLEQNANAMVSSLGRGSQMPAVASSGLAIQCEDENEPEIGYSLDPSKPNAHGTVPIGDGAASAVVDTSGARVKLTMPDSTVDAGYDWQKGSYLNAGAQIGDLELGIGLTPEQIAARAKFLNLEGDMSINKDGVDAGLAYKDKQNTVRVGTEGLEANHQGEGWSLGGKVNEDGARMNGTVELDMFGMPIIADGNAGVENGSPVYGAGVTFPTIPLQPSVGIEGRDGEIPAPYIRTNVLDF